MKYLLLLDLEGVSKDEAALVGHAILQHETIGKRVTQVTLIDGVDLEKVDLERLKPTP